MPRVVVIGLDACPPRLLFDIFRGHLPNLEALVADSLSGPLESTTPPITVPAWTSMVTGVDPGTLGIYGFHDRADYSYNRRRVASSLHVAVPPVWTLLSRAGFTCRVIGVPQTYPPKPLRGALVSGPPLPKVPGELTYPPSCVREIEQLTGGYIPDLPGFRGLSACEVVSAAITMTERRFRLAEAWARLSDWQFLMLVEMGPDRVQHACWLEELLTPEAIAGRTPNPLVDYYRALDCAIGRLVAALRPDDVVLVVSDHGAQTLKGLFAVNDWLIREGFLVLREPPPAVAALDPVAVDWSNTRAWADGGYCGRIHYNVVGREPEGIVSETGVAALEDALVARLGKLERSQGVRASATVLRPAQVYRTLAGIPPGLLFYVDDLAVRVSGKVGHRELFFAANDTGPDGANHAREGVFVLRDGRGRRTANMGLSIYDVAPTLLDRLGVTPPSHMIGRVLS